MELPHVGEHCSNKDCNRLDFLPYKCEYCNKKFCENHWKANDHSCENQHKILDFRIPTCPICNLPVPINRGEDPNYKVENHIRMGCSKIPGKSGKNPGQKGAQCGFDGFGSNGDMSGIPKVYHELIDSFWPGPLTIILPRPNNDLIPDNILGNVQVNSTVAFRFPSHPVARAIIACSNLPLAAPSANSSGKPSPTIASHVEADLRGLIPLVIDSGSCTFGLESTVVDAVSNSLPTMSSENVEISQIDEYNLTTNTATNSDTKQLVKIPCVLRPGGITVEQIMQMKNKNILNEPKNLKTQNNNIDLWKQIQVYGKTFANKVIESAPTTPGMKYKHYSPQAQVSLFIPQSPNHSNHTVENNSSIKKEMIKSIIEIIQNTSTTTKFTNKTLEKSSRIDDKEPTFNNSNEYRIGVIVIEDGSFSWNKALCNLQLENNISDNQKPSKYQISLVNYDFNSPKKPSTNILSSNRNDGDGFVNVIVAIVSGIDGLGNSMFGLLRLMDDFNVEKVLVEGVAEIGQGLAIMNRLKKAATIHISH
ncbi:hypothetical protein BB558_003883 [Smittium angustum]|uniref:Threonylcarbamoyl-AMP synthase n=1 Tax=Smittium angustum TaxID=133377 RepID=A0A2U1J4T5_SMIAN|nr:hypothetical protein BB558_003883 [Smittium angustum]